MDVRPDKLLFAAIRMAPVFGSKLVSVDASRISNPEGLIQVLELEEAVVVVADNSWRAEKMAQELQPQFNETEASSASSTQLDAQYQHALQSSNGELIYSQGNAVGQSLGCKLTKRRIECLF